MKQLLSNGIFFLALCVASSFVVVAQEMPPAQVEVVTVEEKLLAPTIELKGNVVSLNDARIAAEVEGQLEWIAEVGTTFKKGDLIAKIDDSMMTWRLTSAEANLASLKADLEYRESEVQRFTELARKDNAAKNRLQLELVTEAMLRNQIKTAQTVVEQSRKNLRESEVTAPFNGVMVSRQANTGEYFVVGDVMARLVDTDRKEVSVATPINVMHLVDLNKQVTVLNDRNQFDLPVRTVVPVGDMSSRMVEVRLDASKTDWVVGESVKALMPKAEAKVAVAVPRDALIIRGSQRFVYKVNDESQAEQVPVEVAFAVGNWVSVKSGISSGDKVITRGAERLQPGQPVSIK